MSIIYTFRDGTTTTTVGANSYGNLFTDASYIEVDTIFIDKDCVLPAYGIFLSQPTNKILSYLNVGTLFSKCINLQSIKIHPENTYYSSDITGCLFSIDKITLFAYPAGNRGTSYTIPDTVKTIFPYTFMNANNLTTVIIPNNSDNILPLSFANSRGITTITIPNTQTVIPYFAFYNCTSLTSITIPASVTNIYESAFYKCVSLTSVTLPNGLTEISQRAFMLCKQLTTIIFPNSLKN